MPKLGLNMSEGLIVEWLVQEGDQVHKGDALLVVETDKITIESESQADGLLGRILVPAGETVPVGTVVALLVAAGETLPEAAPTAAHPATSAAPPASNPDAPAAHPAAHKVQASPLARRIAKEHGIDLAVLVGTGRDGAITREDVERAIASRDAAPPAPSTPSAPPAPQAAPAAGSSIPLRGVRGVIAERMLSSHLNTARVTLHTEIDATDLVAYRERLRAESGTGERRAPGYNAILGALVARALREHPALNARQEGDAILLLDEVNIGFAVDTERGLLVVVVRGADRKTDDQIEAELGGLVGRALQGSSQPDDLTGSTFTVTNLGSFGIDAFTPVINPPEVAILGVGRIIKKPVAVEGQVALRSMLTLSLSFDHRLVDGAPAARFLQRVAALIQAPYLAGRTR